MSERKRLVEYLFEATVMYRAHKLELPDWRVAVISKARELFFAKEENMTLEKSRGVDAICHILERHELMEILSSLELRIWSCKLLENEIDEGPAGDILDVCQPKRVKLDDREFARVNCGADIIIGNILPFLREPS
ncbi:unnamed protein product [Cylindrotheca closterium]|uniref:Uncharacterized protein n=1 Tax=Cylindrotheca closterium TaxID=2856 RepID=A0AAD2CTB8_9STRA|nr:unnamed protein product [Cylindrotheca closterium]